MTYEDDVRVECIVHANPRVTGARVHRQRTKSGQNSTLDHGEEERYFSVDFIEETVISFRLSTEIKCKLFVTISVLFTT